jgi:hypothetical protein
MWPVLVTVPYWISVIDFYLGVLLCQWLTVSGGCALLGSAQLFLMYLTCKNNNPQSAFAVDYFFMYLTCKNNNPQSAFAQHILHNRYEYGTIEDIMKLVKPVKDPRLLIPYEQLFIQNFYQENTLITEQNPGEHNPLIQLATDTEVHQGKNQ